MGHNILKTAARGGVVKTYVDDVFSTYLYTGNGSTQTITNGIDLAGKGGVVMLRGRATGTAGFTFDTAQGVNKYVLTNSANGQASNTSLTTFNSNGFSLSSAGAISVNDNGNTYASWTFRKQAKFFDVVTYTGTGTSFRQLSHSLGVQPGLVIAKETNGTSNWVVAVKVGGVYKILRLNTTGASFAEYSEAFWTSTDFRVANYGDTDSTLSDDNVNASGQTYVAYLFAHDTAADGIIQCGSFTTDASGNATVNLGWEPQFVLTKASSGVSNWRMSDVMRGMAQGSDNFLYCDSTATEANTTAGVRPTATGFTGNTTFTASTTYIYLAIRRPNKPPTTGTQVFDIQQANYVGGGTYGGFRTANYMDAVLWKNGQSSTSAFWFLDRLRGISQINSGASNSQYLVTSSTASEVGAASQSAAGAAQARSTFLDNNTIGGSASGDGGFGWLVYGLRRAPGVFDVVCYTGTGSATTVAHNLGAVPELIISKERSTSSTAWRVYSVSLGANSYLTLNTTDASAAASGVWPSVSPTTFGLGAYDNNRVSQTYVAYLFATKAGISKVFSYTGNGSSQTINCGFAAGARFVLIKRTDSTGDWYVWDTARGIVAGNDPHLSLNSTAAEVTTDDSVDADSTGFIVNQLASTNINVTSATYIGIAIS